MTAPWDDPYSLLPEIYRLRDADYGQSLEALTGVLAERMHSLRQDIANLYADWFVETCAPDALDDLAAVIAYRALPDDGTPDAAADRRMVPPFQRREVANTIRRRRRSGTFNLIAELCREVAGWPAKAVEGHTLTFATADLRRPEDHSSTLLGVRHTRRMEDIGGPFDKTVRLPGVRRPSSSNAAPETPNASRAARARLFGLTVHLWRLSPYRVEEMPTHQVTEHPANRHTFDWLGHDQPLMTWPIRPAREDAEPHPGRLQFPDFIGRAALEDDLRLDKPRLYGPEGKILCIWHNSREKALAADRIRVADLSKWKVGDEDHVWVDPELGRIVAHGDIWVSYTYGFPCDLGGGAYPRANSDKPALGIVKHHMSVTKRERPELARQLGAYPQVFRKIGEAFGALKRTGPLRSYTLYLAGGRHVWPKELHLPPGIDLEIRAENAKRVEIIIEGGTTTIDSEVDGAGRQSTLTLCGLLVHGSIRIEGPFGTVGIVHSTLVPQRSINKEPRTGQEARTWSLWADRTRHLDVRHSIVGAVRAEEPVWVTVEDSIVDPAHHRDFTVTAVEASKLTTARSTYLGAVNCKDGQIADCMGLGELTASEGHVSASYFPPSLTAHENVIWINRVEDAGAPIFDSIEYGTPTYARLASSCPLPFRTGASDHSEVGVYHDLWEHYRSAALVARLHEAVPVNTDINVLWRT